MTKHFFFVVGVVLFAQQLEAQFGEQLPGMPSFSPDLMQQFGFADEAAMGEESDSGNWYEKLHWWKEAKRVYTVDIHDAMEQVKKTAQDYEEKKKAILTKVNESIASLPVTPTAAQNLIQGFLADIKKKREQLTDTQNEDQLKAVSELDEEEKMLESLKTDFDQLQTIVSRLQEAFDVAAKQVKECENYEEKALEHFERIEKVLDDKKAHHYYDIVENCLDNIRALIQYLVGPLQIYIDQIAIRADLLIPKIKKSLDELEKKGIVVRVLTEQEKAAHEAEAKKKEEARLKALAEKKARDEWNNMAWWRKAFYWIGSFFSSLWGYIKSGVSSLLGLFSGQEKVVTKVVKK